MGSVLHGVYNTNTEQAKLFARYQIETKCSETCRTFRMTPVATALEKGMTAAYSDVLTVCWVAGFGASACIIALVFVLLVKGNKAT